MSERSPSPVRSHDTLRLTKRGRAVRAISALTLSTSVALVGCNVATELNPEAHLYAQPNKDIQKPDSYDDKMIKLLGAQPNANDIIGTYPIGQDYNLYTAVERDAETASYKIDDNPLADLAMFWSAEKYEEAHGVGSLQPTDTYTLVMHDINNDGIKEPFAYPTIKE